MTAFSLFGAGVCFGIAICEASEERWERFWKNVAGGMASLLIAAINHWAVRS